MRSKLTGILLSTAVVLIATTTRGADAKAKITYQDQVSGIFKNRCNSCHNADKQKGGLNLETFGGAMTGGGSGKVIEPGDPDSSTLYLLVTHSEQPTMPPNAPKIPEAELATIKAWIEAGAPESSGSVVTVKAKPKFEFTLDPNSAGKPVGPPAMPVNLSTEPPVIAARGNAIVAMAASPWAPLIAIGGHKQVLLYETTGQRLVGVLPFPEGTIHVLKFSRSGALLVAGGGRGGQSGLAVAWDVKTGKRVFEVGKEYDAVLAADISPDHSLLALGGPSKVLRVYNTADGELVYEQKKHTEWVTAVEFSPDGVLLASGDRNNGLLVWEARTGREFYDLRGHTLAINDLSWRLDSNVFASASEDGTVKLWEMEGGTTIKSVAAHPGGVSSVRFGKDGRFVTTGRDRLTRVWDPSGAKQRDLEAFPEIALEATFTHDSAQIFAGDWSGDVRIWESTSGKRLGNLVTNPASVATRLEQANQSLSALEAQVKALETSTTAPVEAANQAVASTRAAQATANKAVSDAKATLNAAEQALKAKDTARQANVLAAEEGLKKAQAGQASAEQRAQTLALAGQQSQERIAAASKQGETAQATSTAQQDQLTKAIEALKSAAAGPALEQATATVQTLSKQLIATRGLIEQATIDQAIAKALLERNQEESTKHQQELEAVKVATEQARLALEAVKAAEPAHLSERKPLEQAVTAKQSELKTAEAMATTRKAEVDKAVAKLAEVQKSVAAAKITLLDTQGKLSRTKAERDALAQEKQTQSASAAVTSAAQPGS